MKNIYIVYRVYPEYDYETGWFDDWGVNVSSIWNNPDDAYRDYLKVRAEQLEKEGLPCGAFILESPLNGDINMSDGIFFFKEDLPDDFLQDVAFDCSWDKSWDDVRKELPKW